MIPKSGVKPPSPFHYHSSSPEIIRLVESTDARRHFAVDRDVKNTLFERGIDICIETYIYLMLSRDSFASGLHYKLSRNK